MNSCSIQRRVSASLSYSQQTVMSLIEALFEISSEEVVRLQVDDFCTSLQSFVNFLYNEK